ncbi:MAG: histidine kinase [Verrucomicrobiales bacterium]|nr:histidine kinase [Verrucomicrobiales bacterium]
MVPAPLQSSASVDAPPAPRWPSVPWLLAWTLGMSVVMTLLTRLAMSEGTLQLLVPQSADTPPDSPGKTVLRWLLLAHLSAYRAYPWLVLAPWLIGLTARFHFERGRLRTSIPAQGLACLASIAGAKLLNDYLGSRQPDLVVFAISEVRSDSSTNATRQYHARAIMGPEFLASSNFPPTGQDLKQWEAQLRKSLPGLSDSHSPDSNALPPPRHVQFVEHDEVIVRVPPDTSANSPTSSPSPVITTRGLKQTRRLRVGSGLWGPDAWSDYLFHFFAYGSLVGLAHAIHFRRRFQEREHRAMALETSLARTRLHALQAQLHPHFLFNALNSVIALLRQNPRAAEEMLISLSELLRLVLSQSQHQETSIHEEMRFLELYMEIQQLRFGDRLKYVAHVEPGTESCRIPTLLLQPLVENAVRHGIEPTGRPGCVRVTARRRDHRLLLEVRDNGIGFDLAGGAAPRFGVGLSNIQARLTSFFGTGASLNFSTPDDGGFQVTLELPASELPESPVPSKPFDPVSS